MMAILLLLVALVCALVSATAFVFLFNNSAATAHDRATSSVIPVMVIFGLAAAALFIVSFVVAVKDVLT